LKDGVNGQSRLVSQGGIYGDGSASDRTAFEHACIARRTNSMSCLSERDRRGRQQNRQPQHHAVLIACTLRLDVAGSILLEWKNSTVIVLDQQCSKFSVPVVEQLTQHSSFV
jgi:hypothetical protein